MAKFLHRLAIRALVKPYVWAYNRREQTWLTVSIRRAWWAL